MDTTVAHIRCDLEAGITALLDAARRRMQGVSMSHDKTSADDWRGAREAMFDQVADLLAESIAAENGERPFGQRLALINLQAAE